MGEDTSICSFTRAQRIAFGLFHVLAAVAIMLWALLRP
jgi:hypothetical protein